MIEIINIDDLDKYLDRTFWTWGYYPGQYSYKFSRIVPPQEVILTKQTTTGGRVNYPLFNKAKTKIVAYYSISRFSNLRLYESEEEAKEAWNISIQNLLDKLDSNYQTKKNYLTKKFLK